MLKVAEHHKNYAKRISVETQINDFMDESEVKRKSLNEYSSVDSYLMMPVTYKDSNGNVDTEAFERLVYQAHMPEHILQDTRDQVQGVTFKIEPTIRLPDEMTHLVSNADRKGNSLITVAKSIINSMATSGYHGIVSDFDPASSQSYLSSFKNESIINYEEAQGKYTYLVLEDTWNDETDTDKPIKPLRIELELIDGLLIRKTYKQTANNAEWVLDDESDPTMHKGDRFDYIPAQIAKIKQPMLKKIMQTVKKGYQQSAIYYSMVDTLGSGKMIIYTDKDMSTVFAGHEKGLILSPTDKAELIQLRADGASVVKDAMNDLFNSAVEQGLTLNTEGQTVSGESLYLQNANKQIIPTNVASMVSDELTAALRTCAKLEGYNEDEVEFKLHVELLKKPANVEMQKEIREGVGAGYVKINDYLDSFDSDIDIPLKADGSKNYDKYIQEAREQYNARQAEENAALVKTVSEQL